MFDIFWTCIAVCALFQICESGNTLSKSNFIERNDYKGFKMLRGPNEFDNNPKRFEIAANKPDITRIARKFKTNLVNMKMKNEKIDVVFLIDSSSSVGKSNFIGEIKFVKKLLTDFDVSFNKTRVGIATFGSQGKVVRHVDQISYPSSENDKCRLLVEQMSKIKFAGGGTYTYGALKEANSIFATARRDSSKFIFLVTDGFSNGRNPVPMAERLKSKNVTIFTIGIQNGNYAELYNMSSTPHEQHTYLLDSFAQFESLARKALHADYAVGKQVHLTDLLRCNPLCDRYNMTTDSKKTCCDSKADCTCGTLSGHYACVCRPGYYGSGLRGECYFCPNGTYWHESNMCRTCPDVNHVTLQYPAVNISLCVCKRGFKRTEDNRCEGITCPVLLEPENGYFVGQAKACENVLNAACGVRCKSGYLLTGTSLRLCQENGTWSGTEAACVLKTCPSLKIPDSASAFCKNRDLNLYFDYSKRNETFAKVLMDKSKRKTDLMPIDTDCIFDCDEGYYTVGSRERNCLLLAKWDGLQTNCKRVLCPALPNPKHGRYEIENCSKNKVPYGTNCTLICPPGFTVKGMRTRTCGGKKNGVWSHKHRTQKCIDFQAPVVICPKDYEIIAGEKDNFVVVQEFLEPLNVSDSSGGEVKYWLKPSFNRTKGIKLRIGVHKFSYEAVDAFGNKGRCGFQVKVVDVTPPVVEYCVDPESAFYFSGMSASNLMSEWEEPSFYENSGSQIVIDKHLDRAIIGPGRYNLTYVARDLNNNTNSCSLNITVKDINCDFLPSPQNGYSTCAKNTTHTWCDIVCGEGYLVNELNSDSLTETVRHFCSKELFGWDFDIIPDCIEIALPESVEYVLTIPMYYDDEFCQNELTHLDTNTKLEDVIKENMCGDMKECTVLTDGPDCASGMLGTKQEDIDKHYYKVTKREIRTKKNNEPSGKVKVYVRIGKKLGVWDKNNTLSDNIRRVKYELQFADTNESLRRSLQSMNIDLEKLEIDSTIRCPTGSVSKYYYCVPCPPGTYHDVDLARCQLCPIGTYNAEIGQDSCISCPIHFSTRKAGRRRFEECKMQCPPGTAAKMKVLRHKLRPELINKKSLMPFCRKCNPGEYQGDYDAVTCEKCPPNYTSYRESTSKEHCYPEYVNPCKKGNEVCGEFGSCETDEFNPEFYVCNCMDGHIGAHCEQKLDLCYIGPCANNGVCHYVNETSIECECPSGFTGNFCEKLKKPCLPETCMNGGTCVEVEDNVECECPAGYYGEFCEHLVDHCLQDPCEHGFCKSTLNGYECVCHPGFIGKRCNLQPCDYRPCHRNAICLNLQNYPTTDRSYSCKCPPGLKGTNCTDIENPCDSNPCSNNGECLPALPHQNVTKYFAARLINDKRRFKCSCPPYFYGENCEIYTSPDFVVKFETSNTRNFIKVKGPSKDLKDVSFCIWLQTDDNFNYGTLLSYATESVDNMFTFTDYNGFVLYVHGNHVVTDLTINDGFWHFICVTWTSDQGRYEVYSDGEVYTAETNLSSNMFVLGDGVMVLGQEQDAIATGFSETESFVGNMAYFDMWDRLLTPMEVSEFYASCQPYRGSLYSWADFKHEISGNLVLSDSPFCKPCPQNLKIENGIVEIVDNKAYYICKEGFVRNGDFVRNCLRTSQWSQGNTYCEIVKCKSPEKIINGQENYSDGTFGSIVEYICDEGFELVGTSTRQCTSNGTWSSAPPTCKSTHNCKPMRLIPNAKISYSNERGYLNTSLTEFPIDTYAEIICDKGHDDDMFFVCQKDGIWEGPESSCILDLTTPDSFGSPEQRLSTTDDENKVSIDPTSSLPTSSTSRVPTSNSSLLADVLDAQERLPTTQSSSTSENDEPIYPSKGFLTDFKEYLFHGCSSDNKNKSSFCYILKNVTKITNLATFEPPFTEEYQQMDAKLYHLLESNYNSFRSSSENDRIENLLNFMFYGKYELDEVDLIPAEIEKSLRYLLCFYIDTLVWDYEFFAEQSDLKFSDDIAGQIKSLILKYIAPIKFQLNKNEKDTQPDISKLMTTEAMPVQECLLKEAYDPPENGVISSVNIPHRKRLYADISILRSSSEQVPPSSEIFYGCDRDHFAMGDFVSFCQESGQWSRISYYCKPMGCNSPVVETTMNYAGQGSVKFFRFGDQVQLQCATGLKAQGNPWITCLHTGNWTPLLMKCLTF